MNTLAISIPDHFDSRPLLMAVAGAMNQRGGALITGDAIPTKDGRKIPHLVYAMKQKCVSVRADR